MNCGLPTIVIAPHVIPDLETVSQFEREGKKLTFRRGFTPKI
jgi:hypothetical protein